MTMFKYLIFIRINLLRFYFSIFSLVLVSIEKMYQTLEQCLTKNVKVCQKYDGVRSIFNSLLGVWKFGQIHVVLRKDYLSECERQRQCYWKGLALILRMTIQTLICWRRWWYCPRQSRWESSLYRWIQRGSHHLQVGEWSHKWNVVCSQQYKNVASIQFS